MSQFSSRVAVRRVPITSQLSLSCHTFNLLELHVKLKWRFFNSRIWDSISINCPFLWKKIIYITYRKHQILSFLMTEHKFFAIVSDLYQQYNLFQLYFFPFYQIFSTTRSKFANFGESLHMIGPWSASIRIGLFEIHRSAHRTPSFFLIWEIMGRKKEWIR